MDTPSCEPTSSLGVETTTMKIPYLVAWSLAGAVLIPIASVVVLWTRQQAPSSGLSLAVPVGAVAGFIVGACFRGKENKGAVLFSAFFGIGMGIEGSLEAYSASGLVIAIGDFVNEALIGIVAGAIYGRLVVAIVKWLRQEVGARIHGSASEAIVGCLMGGIVTTALMAVLVVLRTPYNEVASIQTQFMEALAGDIGGSLFGFVPVSIAGCVAGAIAGAVTPRPETARVSE